MNSFTHILSVNFLWNVIVIISRFPLLVNDLLDNFVNENKECNGSGENYTLFSKKVCNSLRNHYTPCCHFIYFLNMFLNISVATFLPIVLNAEFAVLSAAFPTLY